MFLTRHCRKADEVERGAEIHANLAAKSTTLNWRKDQYHERRAVNARTAMVTLCSDPSLGIVESPAIS